MDSDKLLKALEDVRVILDDEELDDLGLRHLRVRVLDVVERTLKEATCTQCGGRGMLRAAWLGNTIMISSASCSECGKLGNVLDA